MSVVSGSALADVEHAFGNLVKQATPLVFDGRGIDGLEAPILLDELRHLLKSGRLHVEVVDAVWRQLAVAARQWGQPWRLVAIGMAVPALTGMAAKISRGRRAHADDVDAELLTGFLDAVLHARLDPPRLWLRLCWQAWRAGVDCLPTIDMEELTEHIACGSRTPKLPYGHPDFLLGRAAAIGIITTEAAELISATRFGHELIEQLAAQRGLSAPVLRMRRRRAELLVGAAVQRGELSVAVRRDPRLSASPISDLGLNTTNRRRGRSARTNDSVAHCQAA